MGKLVNSLLLIAAIDLCMMMFLGVTTPTSSLIALVLTPELWSNMGLITKIVGLTTAAGLTGIIIGSIWYKSDFLVYASITSIFLSYGYSFVQFSTALQANPAFQNNPLVLLIITPILVAYLYVLLKFWRGWD